MATSIGHSVAAVAIRFILDYIKESIVLVGIKNERQLISNLEAMDFSITQKQIEQLLEVSK